MPEIEILDILSIKCNTIGTQEAERAAKYHTNPDNGQISLGEQLYTHPRQLTGLKNATQRQEIQIQNLTT